MSNLKAWAWVFRGFGVLVFIVGIASLFVLRDRGVVTLVIGLVGGVGLFFWADVVVGFEQIVAYFARQNRKAGK